MRCLLHAILIQLAFWEICLCNSWPSQELCNLAGPITRNKVGLALAIYELVSRSVPTSSFFQSQVKFLRLATCVVVVKAGVRAGCILWLKSIKCIARHLRSLKQVVSI